MKKLLFALLFLASPAFAQTQTQYYTVPTIAALKAMTTSRPAVVQVVDANPGIFNLSAGACAAADDIFQVQPTSGTTVCYTRMSKMLSTGGFNSTFVASGSYTYTLPTTSNKLAAATGTIVSGNLAVGNATLDGFVDSGLVPLTQLPGRTIWGNNSASTSVPAALTVLTLGNGTAAAPIYSFGASTGTGLYSPTTNYAGIAAGGKLGVQIRNTDSANFMEYIYSGQVIWRAANLTGTTATIDATYAANGLGNVYLQGNGASTNGILGRFSPGVGLAVGDANNYVRFLTGATGAGPIISPVAQGTGNTNIPLNVDPLGTAALQTIATLFRLGGTTASFPALKRSTTAIQVRLADDSNYAPLAASGYSAGATAGIVSCTVVTLGATITITGGIITAFTGC